MNIYAATSLIGSTSALFLGLFVFIKNKERIVNRFFGLLSLGIFIWVFGCFMESSVQSKAIALWADRFLYSGAAFAPLFFLHFSLIITEKSRKHILPFYALAVVFLVFNVVPHLRPFFIRDVAKIFPFRYIALPGPLWYVYLLYFVCCGIYALWNFIKALKSDVSESKRLQLKYMIFSLVVIYVAACMYLCLVLSVATPPIDNLMVAVFSFITAYAIVRHKLMAIEVVIKKTLVFAGLFAGVYAIVAGITFLTQLVFEQFMGSNRWIALIPSITIIVIALRPLENMLLRMTDKVLFQKKYNYRDLLKTFSTDVLTVLNKEKLVKTTVESLSNIMRIESCGVLLLNKETHVYELEASVGIDRKVKGISLISDNTLTSFLERTKSYLSTKHQGKDSPLPKRIVDDMNKLNLEIAIPLVLHADMIGVLTLGKKKSDREYTSEDMDILLALARTLAIAISNATVLDELGQTQAEAAQREKMAVIGTLSAGINHEICNPLGIVRGQCEAYLLNKRDGLYDKKSESELLNKTLTILEKVIHETDRATLITKRLSSFAKPSKGELDDEVNVRESIDEVLALIGYEMKLENIDVVIDIANDLPYVIGDRKQLQEVFFNLIRNSAQAIGEQGSISIRAIAKSNSMSIEIEDSGEGIAEDKLGQIFNPFFTTKGPDQGTGLGLFIVRQVVERNSGQISVKSTVGQGTTFYLRFPISKRIDALNA